MLLEQLCQSWYESPMYARVAITWTYGSGKVWCLAGPGHSGCKAGKSLNDVNAF
jgi:trehalose utilization protein